MHEVNIQTLYDLVVCKKSVDPWHLTLAAEGLYRSVKIVNIENTTVSFVDESNTQIHLTGTQVPERVRAVAALIVRLLHRWDDSLGRLEQHYALSCPIHLFLGDLDIFTSKDASLPCISVSDVINSILRTA